MVEQADLGTRQVVLDLIIEKGPVSSGAIARILKLTAAAVRRHITTLEERGMIVIHEPNTGVKKGRGRPSRFYVATDKGRGRLEDGHADLALKAVGYLGKIGGEEAIEAFMVSRSRELERRYAPVVKAAGQDAHLRAQALADALTLDGYAATVRPVGDGTFAIQLCQGHCPIGKIAEEYPQACDAELQAFGRMIGVHVQRLATLAQGEHVCTTNIPVGITPMRTGMRTQVKKKS